MLHPAAFLLSCAAIIGVMVWFRDRLWVAMLVALAAFTVLFGAFLVRTWLDERRRGRHLEERAKELSDWGETLRIGVDQPLFHSWQEVHMTWTEAVAWATERSTQESVNEAFIVRFTGPEKGVSVWTWKNGSFAGQRDVRQDESGESQP
jgi:hypothetical protein